MTSAERMRRSREKKSAAETPNIKTLLRENVRLKKKIIEQRAHIVALKKAVKDDNWWQALRDVWKRDAAKTFTDEDIKLLKQLVHPDKHDQSPAAVKAMIKLNKLAKRFCG